MRHVQSQVPRDLQPTAAAARGTKAQGGENGGPEGPLSAPRIRDSMGFYGFLSVFMGFLWDVIFMFR